MSKKDDAKMEHDLEKLFLADAVKKQKVYPVGVPIESVDGWVKLTTLHGSDGILTGIRVDNA